MMHAALQSILQYGGWAQSDSDRIRFLGSDPVFPTPYRIGTAGAAALGAIGLAVASLREHRSGRHPDVEIDVRAAGGCAPAVRTREEWLALANTATLAAEPLVEIRRIGDSEPVALPARDRPLAGVRALDLTRVLAGPTCGRLLAEWGADVLKITCERHPDFSYFEGDTGYGKRKAMLDIASPAGRERFEALLRGCDVFRQAYRPGAMAGLGFSSEQVAALRPGIVYASLNAFGFTGAWRGRRGFDTVIQAASGMARVRRPLRCLG